MVLYLASIMTSNYKLILLPSVKNGKVPALFKNAMKTFSKTIYRRIFELSHIKTFFVVLQQAGFFTAMIDAYPVLFKSKDAYSQLVSRLTASCDREPLI